MEEMKNKRLKFQLILTLQSKRIIIKIHRLKKNWLLEALYVDKTLKVWIILYCFLKMIEDVM